MITQFFSEVNVMLPIVVPDDTLETVYLTYLTALRQTKFSGEIRTDYASRLAVATDNSVYQVIPQAVIFPRSTLDISLLLLLASHESYDAVTFSPRGGGTATNGQSLTKGIVIDCSKYMAAIEEVNTDENWVRVQPGVILDQLNDALKKQNRCFATQISPSNRATLGGMINTDACGNGSKLLGRMSDQVIDLTCVLHDGRVVKTSQLESMEPHAADLKQLLQQHQVEIQRTFAQRPRNLNGYNLLRILQEKIDFNYLFCGSEGTLGVISDITLKIHPIPRYKKLVLVKYSHFDAALRSHDLFEKVKPLVIEAIDEQLVDMARHDTLYLNIKEMLDGGEKAGAVNLVEFVSEDQKEIESAVNLLCHEVVKSPHCLGYYIAKNEAEIKLLWDLRKKSVGLISQRQQGTRRPIPFIEDTAVPPEKLADYIAEFAQLLQQYGLIYGMYGHVDAGCVHVRPALDLKQREDEKIFKELSDKVALLVEKYGGVMWGEHGQGFRCHYGEQFFGNTLYHVIRQIKTWFDPKNKLNPGKIAVPLSRDASVVELTESLRAYHDRQILPDWQVAYENVLSCNGNGACFNYASQEVMCPSYKVTKDRIHSPKGRASLVREWLKQLSHGPVIDLTLVTSRVSLFSMIKKIRNIFCKKDFSHEVYQAMQGCLACKGCAGQCPLSVDIPAVKSTFLYHYHTRYLRPLRDYLIGGAEKIARLQRAYPKINRWLLQLTIVQWVISRGFHVIQPPLPETMSVDAELKKRLAPEWHGQPEKNAVVLLQDSFTTTYEPHLVLSTYDFLKKLGYIVYVLPLFDNGKPLYAQGFLPAFRHLAKKNIAYLQKIQQSGVSMIGIDPSITLTYRDEYRKIAGVSSTVPRVELLQEWLCSRTNNVTRINASADGKTYYLLAHCTEKAMHAATETQWQAIFSAFGLTLTPVAVGCCGMAGSFGHETEHQSQSRELFTLDWGSLLRDNQGNAQAILATGYSCRCQVKRFTGMTIQHPIEILLSAMLE